MISKPSSLVQQSKSSEASRLDWVSGFVREEVSSESESMSMISLEHGISSGAVIPLGCLTFQVCCFHESFSADVTNTVSLTSWLYMSHKTILL